MTSFRSLQSGQALSRLGIRAGGMLRAGVSALYPPQCLLCGELVQTEGGLCAACWRDTPFCHGLRCDLCGVPLPGDDPGTAVTCDDCRDLDRPWVQGRSVMLYDGGARRLALALKHGDRLDMVPALAGWLAVQARPLLRENTLLVPVPAHWRRLFRRRYNQAAVLANALGALVDCRVCPDLLIRRRPTTPQEDKSVEARFQDLEGAFAVNPRRTGLLAGTDLLLVDDVMTSGATLDGCTRAALAGGAATVRVLVLARVSRDA